MHGIVHPRLLFLELDFGRGADFDDGYAAGQLRQPLLQFLAIVIRGGLRYLRADQLDTALDLGFLAGPADERGVVLVDRDPAASPELVELNILELLTEILRI